MKNQFSSIEILCAFLIVIFFGTISTIMVSSAIRDDRNRLRSEDLKAIQKKVELFKDNGGKVAKKVEGHDQWQIATFSPATNPDSIDNDAWTSRDLRGNKLSFYFPNETYPQDPKGGSYSIHIIDSKTFEYWLKACDPKAGVHDESRCLIIKSQ